MAAALSRCAALGLAVFGAHLQQHASAHAAHPRVKARERGVLIDTGAGAQLDGDDLPQPLLQVGDTGRHGDLQVHCLTAW
jgi:hypothetical protein